MARALLVILLGACGRVGFGAVDSVDDGSIGGGDGTGATHDEDGDGLVDIADPCPHIAVGGGDDSDGDLIGDACDPQPLVARQRRAVFATMRPEDQPLATGAMGTGMWTQHADSIGLTGSYGELHLDLAVADVSFEFGFDIIATGGTAGDQRQFACSIESGTLPLYLAELNDVGPFDFAAITEYDGTGYRQIVQRPLAMGVHPGSTVLRFDAFAGSTPKGIVTAGWPGELYTGEIALPSYAGGNMLTVDINNLELELRYVWIVTSN